MIGRKSRLEKNRNDRAIGTTKDETRVTWEATLSLLFGISPGILPGILPGNLPGEPQQSHVVEKARWRKSADLVLHRVMFPVKSKE
jgi:hypothetical protein